MVCCGQIIFHGTREELEVVDNTIFGSECGLGEVGVTVLHIVTDDLVFGGCIKPSMTEVLV